MLNLLRACVLFLCVEPRYDFTTDRDGGIIPDFKAFVKGVRAKGGWDRPEDVIGGLKTALALQWPRAAGSRVLFHIGDAPPHGTPLYHDNVCVPAFLLSTEV